MCVYCSPVLFSSVVGPSCLQIEYQHLRWSEGGGGEGGGGEGGGGGEVREWGRRGGGVGEEGEK